MQNLSGQILLPLINGVAYGAGCVKDQLSATLEQMGVKRVFLITTPSLTRTDLVDQLKANLGSRCAGIFSQSVAHTPQGTVEKAVAQAREINADCLVSFGGSSVVDLAKAVALTLAEGDDYDGMKVRFSPETGAVIPNLQAPKMPHIAVPTTLSSSEYTFAVAITDESIGEKNLFADMKLAPKWIFQDPLLCTATPRRLWVSTGMKIFADCIELICSTRAIPYTDSLALSALELLHKHLPASLSGDATQARGHCLAAGFMTMANAHNVSLGMVAALRHQLGANQHISHGEASTIVLPHVLRFNRPLIDDKLARISNHLGLGDTAESAESAAEEFIESVEAMIDKLGIASRLRDLGVDASALPEIAAHAAQDFAMASNPRPLQSAEQALGVLRSAY